MINLNLKNCETEGCNDFAHYGYKIDNKGRSSVNIYYEPFANVNRNSTQLVYNGDLSSQIMDQIN